MQDPAVSIKVCQPLRPGELFDFYVRNEICEAKFGRSRAEDVLNHPGVWVAAYEEDRLIGFGRALTDAQNAVIVELCLDLTYQDYNEYGIGCFIDSDPNGIGRMIAIALLKELRARGCSFFNVVVPDGTPQVSFYRSLGFDEHVDHTSFIIDARDYVPGGPERGAKIDEC